MIKLVKHLVPWKAHKNSPVNVDHSSLDEKDLVNKT